VSLVTTALLKSLQAQRPTSIADGLQATVGGGQGAISLRDACHRFLYVKNVGDSCVLPSLAMHEAMVPLVFVVNDGTNALNVFPWPGDSLNGVTNSPLSVPAGSVAIAIKVDTGLVLDWRAGVIS
jgi:hypothetical protein